MSDLTVKTQLLRDAATSLSQLLCEFGSLEGRHDGSRSVWGSDAVAAALDEFAGNWDDRRRRISDAMTSLQEMAQATAEEFERLEAEFSTALDR